MRGCCEKYLQRLWVCRLGRGKISNLCSKLRRRGLIGLQFHTSLCLINFPTGPFLIGVIPPFYSFKNLWCLGLGHEPPAALSTWLVNSDHYPFVKLLNENIFIFIPVTVKPLLVWLCFAQIHALLALHGSIFCLNLGLID